MNANNLWVNQRDGTFRDEALIAGCAYNGSGAAEAGMGVTAGDYDGDGDEDLFVTHLDAQTNTLYQNDGSGAFIDVSDIAGLSVPSLAYTGFGTGWFDVDNDGLLDLFSANGAVRIVPALAALEDYPYRQRNQLFVNQGRGRFADVSAAADQVMAVELVSRGTAFGDIDNDGDTDLVVSNNSGPARLLLNRQASERWLRVRLVGTNSNRDGTGARVALMDEETALMWRRAHTDGSYLSASDGRVHFGLAGSPAVNRILVLWPSQVRETWPLEEFNREVELVEGTGQPLAGLSGDS